MQVCQVSASSSSRFLKRRILNFFLENLPFMSPHKPIKSSDLDKSRVKHGGLLNKHFCKIKNQISPMTWQKLSISTFPIISLWKLKVASNQSSYPTEIKNITFVEGNVLSKYAKFRLHPPYGF